MIETSEMASVFGKQSTTLTKIEKYGWVVKDAPGELVSLHKSILKVSPEYQRRSMSQRVLAISASWSWIALGAISVGRRESEFWVIDGQHRVLAALQRSDISNLPCIVFATDSIQQEAQGFLDANTGRKSVSTIDKFRAALVAGDATAKYVDSVLSEFGITPKGSANKPLEIKSLGWAMQRAKDDRDAFRVVVELAAELCQDCMLNEKLLDGLFYIHSYYPTKLENKRLRDRLKKVGALRLIDATTRASAYYSRGGAKVWADGIISEVNKGLHYKVGGAE